MRTCSRWLAALAVSAVAAMAQTCSCGTNPPSPPPVRTLEPYANTPEDLQPFSRFTKPYYEHYTKTPEYNGAASDVPTTPAAQVGEVAIGFLGPIENHKDLALGVAMRRGAELAIAEANARGGYCGKPFRLMIHNDAATWGASSNEIVKMVYDEKVWAMLGSISGDSTHIALRVSLRAELPIVNSASTDPTIPETYIPWYFTDLQDDRVQCLTLARHIFTELGLKRVAILRVNSRYGRFGVLKLRDAARRLGHPIVIEQKYLPGDSDFTKQLSVIRSMRADAIVLWADETQAAEILKEMRAAGMKQRVFGAYRTLGPTLLAEAGDAAEGFAAVFPYDPTRNDARWLEFNQRFEARFHEKPEQFASLAYDAMNMLLDSICKAGLNRARIHDALANIEEYDGVTGHMIFDPNQKNVAPMYLGTVHNGTITYRVATMEKAPAAGQTPPENEKQSRVPSPYSLVPVPYARVGEDGVDYAGPHRADVPPGPVRVILFGPKANEIARSPEMLAELASAAARGREWKLEPVATDQVAQNWGAASTALVHALMDEHALVIVALDRDAAHLAEQLALKAFVPVLALSSDKALTSTNVPWIFRLPAQTAPVDALRLIKAAAVRSGPNPERLRDELASGSSISGVAFLPTGEPRGQD